jgi:hypothetical protein
LANVQLNVVRDPVRRDVAGLVGSNLFPEQGEGMFWQRIRLALLVGVLSSGAVASAQASHGCAAPCAPVCCTEWVREAYPVTRTCYRTEYKQETYTAYRCECVPETRTFTCTVYKRVPEVQTVTRTVCVSVPTCEERTVMQACWTCKPVTCTVRKCIDQGHWECREVPVCEKHHFLSGCLKKLRKHHSCEECCEPCCPPPTKIVKVWVPCPVWVEVPVTTLQRVCEYKPVTIKVTVCKTEVKQVPCQVTCWRCVPEVQPRTCQVMTTRMVPYQATRCVPVCIPYQETITCYRLVAKPAPAAPAAPAPTACCETPCCEPCCVTTCCKPKCHKHRCSGLFHRSSCCD